MPQPFRNPDAQHPEKVHPFTQIRLILLKRVRAQAQQWSVASYKKADGADTPGIQRHSQGNKPPIVQHNQLATKPSQKKASSKFFSSKFFSRGPSTKKNK